VSGAAKFPAHRSVPFTGLPLTALLRSAPLRSFDFLSFDPLRSAARPDLRGEVRAPDLPTNRGPTTPVIFSFFFAADYISYMLTFNKAFSYK